MAGKKVGRDLKLSQNLPPVTKRTFPDRSPISLLGSKEDPNRPKVASLSVGPRLEYISNGWRKPCKAKEQLRAIF